MKYQGIIPYICIRGAAEAMEFYKKAFNATETMRHTDPDGKVRHAELVMSGGRIMLYDEFPEFADYRSIQSFQGSPIQFFLVMDDVDAMYSQALAAGCSAFATVEDKPYGRTGAVRDPYGVTWWLSRLEE